ncbi:MAG: heavy-metal-associated domain-containing protein [Ignavibacteria bacterium]|nr:heavy-metal-associated domain-containing protein [Ignavibacteria bacterium]
MKHLLSVISIFLILFSSIDSNAQLKEIIIGVDGFTCSLCAKGVEGQFKALDFVRSVKTDLKNTQFTITLKDNTTVNLKEINEAVTDGGFTVREIIVEGNGKISSIENEAYSVITGNSAVLKLHSVKEEFLMDDNVNFKGKLSEDAKSVTVTEIRKI